MKLVTKISGTQAQKMIEMLGDEKLFDFRLEGVEGCPIVAIYVESDGPVDKLEEIEVTE